MPMYDVEVIRSERITYRLEADNPEDADNRALLDGEETDSSSAQPETLSVTLVTD